MKVQILILVACFCSASFGQVLRSNGKYLELVHKKDHTKRLNDSLYLSCDCTEYVRNYEIEEDTGKIYFPVLNENKQLTLLDNNNNWVLVNKKGKQQYQFPFESWSGPNYFEEGKYTIQQEDTTYLFTTNHELIKKGRVSRYKNYADGYLWSNEEGKYAILDLDGNNRTPFDFTCTSWDSKNFGFYKNGIVAVKNSDKKCGILTYKGDTIVPFIYDFIDDPGEDQIYVQKDGLWGTIDAEGNVIAPIIYQELPYPDFYENKINLVKTGGKWMATDSAFKPLNQDVYEVVKSVTLKTRGSSSPAPFKIYAQNGKFGLLEAHSELIYITEAIFDSIVTLNKTTLCFKNRQVSFYDKEGNFLRKESEYNLKHLDKNGLQITRYADGAKMLWAEKNGKWGIQTFEGEMILPADYEEIKFQNDHFIFKQSGKYGLADWNGNIIIEAAYDQLEITHLLDTRYDPSLLVRVSKDGKTGILNEKNEVLIDLKYEDVVWANPRKETIYVSKLGENYFILDKKGEVIEEIQADDYCLTDREYLYEIDYYDPTIIFYKSKIAHQYLLNGKLHESKPISEIKQPCSMR